MIDDIYLLPLTIFFMLVALAALAYKAQQRRGYAPLFLGLAAAVLVVVGKFYFDNAYLSYGGTIPLVVAAIWNIWPSKKAESIKTIPSKKR